MSKNYKWGIFPGKWGAKAKKRLPRRTKKNGGSLPRNPKTDISRDASRFRRSGAPEAIRPVPNTLRGAFVCLQPKSRTTERHSPNRQPAAVGKYCCVWTAGIRPARRQAAPISKQKNNDPISTAELRIGGLSKMQERCCCPKRCTCQGFAHLLANPDSDK